MNDESIDINLSFINTDYFSVSVRDGAISVIGRITKDKVTREELFGGYDLSKYDYDNLTDKCYEFISDKMNSEFPNQILIQKNIMIIIKI